MSNVSTSFYSYIPNNTPHAVLHSGIYSYFAASLLSGRVHTGIDCMIMGCVASAISAVTVPLFQRFFEGTGLKPQWLRYGVVRATNLALTYLLIHAVSDYRLNLIASIVFSIILPGVFSRFKEDFSTPTYIII